MTCFKIIDESTRQSPSRVHNPSTRVYLRVDQAHVKRVLKARRDLCIGEQVVTENQRRLIKFVALHGFTAKPVDGDAVEFDLPAFNVFTFAKTYQTERVSNMAQARAALGY